jgi:phosphonate C-P lyase system protein PhnG
MKKHPNGGQPSGTNRESIRNLLPDMTVEEVDNLIAGLPIDQVQVITPPATGLIMARVRDCFGTDFFLGEILVTRAEVAYGDHQAQATLMGSQSKHALVAAILDVLDMGGQTALLEKAAMACRAAQERIEQAQRTEARLVAATRVQFESMAEED